MGFTITDVTTGQVIERGFLRASAAIAWLIDKNAGVPHYTTDDFVFIWRKDGQIDEYQIELEEEGQ